MADDAILLRAVAANHRAWFRRTALAAGGTVERLGRGLELATSGASGTIGFPPPGARAALTARVDAVLARADALGLRMLGCMALHEDRTLGTLLVARGFEWGWAPHWMALDLARAPGDPTAAHTVVPAPDALPRDLPYAVGRRPAPARHLAVLEGDRPVGHVVVHPWRGVAGIYDMGVAPDRRRRGVGRALTLAAAGVAAIARLPPRRPQRDRRGRAALPRRGLRLARPRAHVVATPGAATHRAPDGARRGDRLRRPRRPRVARPLRR